MSEKWITEGSVGAWVFQNRTWPLTGEMWVGIGVAVGLVVACVLPLARAVRLLERLRSE